MGVWQKQVSFKSLVIGMVAGVALLAVAAYQSGIKEAATLEGMLLLLLFVLFLILSLKHYEVRRRKEASLFKELKQRQKSDK